MKTPHSYYYFLRIIVTAVIIFSFAVPYSPVIFAQSSEGSDGFYVSGTSDKITLELKGVDIIDVLKVLSKKSGLNIIAGKNVRGQVTLFLQNVDVREALKVVLESSELAYEEENGIIKVITQRDYEAKYGKPYDDRRETEVIKLKYADAQAISQMLGEIKTNIGKIIVDDRTNSITLIDLPEVLENMKRAIRSMDQPTSSKVFPLKYGDAEDIEAKITEVLTPTSGIVKVDKRTNKIIVMDYPERIKQIEEIINAFDAQPRQVLIDAKIIQVTLNDDYAFGVDWTAIISNSGKQRFSFDSNAFGARLANPDYTGTNLTSFTINSEGDDFYAVIQALEGMGKTNTLSSPRVTVMSGEEAKLSVATRQPYVSQTVVQGDSSSTTADNVEFVDVGVILTVLPKIADDNMIMLKIKPEISSSTESLELDQFDSEGNVTGTRTTVPIVTSQEVETTVLVRHNRTLVLGGLLQDTETKTMRKLPILGDIPLVGNLFFKNETVENTKSEVVIFLRPAIIGVFDYDKFESDQSRFVDDEGEFLDFDKVGDKKYDFKQAYVSSMTPLEKGNKPYWKRQQEKINKEVIQYFNEKESQGEGKTEVKTMSSVQSRPQPIQMQNHARRVNASSVAEEMEKDAERASARRQAYVQTSRERAHRSAVSSVASNSRQTYIYNASTKINRAVAARSDLARYRGTTSTVILNVLNDGTIDSIGYSKVGVFAQPKVREAVTQAIVSSSPLARFPSDMSSQQERLEVQISL